MKLDRAAKQFGASVAVQDISLEIKEGERLVVLGPSGSGKTTLLRLMAGLEVPNAGSVTMDGRDVADIPAYERDIAFMFQEPALWQHMTLWKNVAFGASDRSAASLSELFELAGLSGLEKRRPDEVSGGQAQRASLLRALASGKSTILLDEPFAHIDDDRQAQIIELIDSRIKGSGAALVVASHDPELPEMLGASVLNLRVG
jgi:sulfate transport system ATP-binding protein